jgi:hypothetical protein
MNERIRKLAEQATTYIEPTYSSGEGWIFDKEKFAELIVRECEQVSLKNSHRDDDMGAIIAKQIREHFGVEL